MNNALIKELTNGFSRHDNHLKKCDNKMASRSKMATVS